MSTREEVEAAYKRNNLPAKVKRNRFAVQDFQLIYDAYTEIVTWAAQQPCENRFICEGTCLTCQARAIEGAPCCASCGYWDGNTCRPEGSTNYLGICSHWDDGVYLDPELMKGEGCGLDHDPSTLFGFQVKHNHNPPIEPNPEAPPPFVIDDICRSCAALEDGVCILGHSGNIEQVPAWSCHYLVPVEKLSSRG